MGAAREVTARVAVTGHPADLDPALAVPVATGSCGRTTSLPGTRSGAVNSTPGAAGAPWVGTELVSGAVDRSCSLLGVELWRRAANGKNVACGHGLVEAAGAGWGLPPSAHRAGRTGCERPADRLEDVMSAVPPTAELAGAPPTAAAEHAVSRLGTGEAAVVITTIAAVTVLAVLERPIPMVLTMLAGAVMVLLTGRRAGRLLAAVAALAASGGGRG